MTAPGDSVLLLILFAVFLACCGYAGGRAHQRYLTSQDREDAYRDGYETGTRSVFSTAVRMLGPRRPVRASAPVAPVTPPEEPTRPVEEPVRPVEEPAQHAEEVTVPVAAPPLGFPLPAPPPPYAVIDPPAVGGVTYHQFPDPRPADGSGPTLNEPRPRLSDRSGLALGTTRTEGRHTVPDELVQATTYQLPPDRIFRARVKDGSRLPEEPTTRIGVPKPRES
jgi:hypothetical protein